VVGTNAHNHCDLGSSLDFATDKLHVNFIISGWFSLTLLGMSTFSIKIYNRYLIFDLFIGIDKKHVNLVPVADCL
jgi:hypothetical protein